MSLPVGSNLREYFVLQNLITRSYDGPLYI